MNKKDNIFTDIIYFIVIILLFLTILFHYSVYSFTDHNSVVTINNGLNKASGFVYKNYIITNAHICMTNFNDYVTGKNPNVVKNITIITNKNKKFTSSSIKIHKATDLCKITIKEQLESFSILWDYKPKYLEQLKIFTPTRFNNPNVLYGKKDDSNDLYSNYTNNSHLVFGKGRYGMSGSPVINQDRLVIGVMWAISEKNDFIYYISIDELKGLLNE